MHKLNKECLIKKYSILLNKISCLSPLMMLTVRLWIARVFFNAGLVKISDFGNTVALFRDEYKTPFLPPEVAAGFATTFELSCSILIALGFFARFASLPLIIMTTVIIATYDNNIQHYYWIMLLGMIFFYGADKISLDYVIKKHIEKKKYE